jgi:uncharacterized protein YutE (UPF0331/DUF86 family)
MEKGTLSLLEADVQSRLGIIERIYQKIYKRKVRFEQSQIRLESLSYQLHNLYSAFEDLMKVVADFFENKIEERERWHIRLLERMKEEIRGIRPALFSEKTYQLLNELRAFRHRFRHTYFYELDPEGVKLILTKALEVKTLYKKEVEQFLKKLAAEVE